MFSVFKAKKVLVALENKRYKSLKFYHYEKDLFFFDGTLYGI